MDALGALRSFTPAQSASTHLKAFHGCSIEMQALALFEEADKEQDLPGKC